MNAVDLANAILNNQESADDNDENVVEVVMDPEQVEHAEQEQAEPEQVQAEPEQAAEQAEPTQVKPPVPMEPTEPEIFYRVEASDGSLLKMSSKALAHSRTLFDMVGYLDLSPEKAEALEPLPVSNVNGPIMELIIEWCEHHKNTPVPKETSDSVPKHVEIPEWDDQWLDEQHIDNEQLFDLICGANYLNIPLLLDYTCKTVALMAANKSPEELRVVFNIPADMDEEADELANKLAGTCIKEDQPSTSSA